MALQCAQLLIPTGLKANRTLKVVASSRNLSQGRLSQTGLQNSNSTLKVRFLRHCKRDSTWHSRQLSRFTVCVRAGEPKPTWIEMTPITGEAEFNEVLESGNPVIIDWCSLFLLSCS